MAKWKDKAAKARHEQENNNNNQGKKDKHNKIDTINVASDDPMLAVGRRVAGNGDNSELIVGVHAFRVPVEKFIEVVVIEAQSDSGANKGATRFLTYPKGAHVRLVKEQADIKRDHQPDEQGP